MDLKVLLGEAYKDGMTFEDVQTALESYELPKDMSSEVEKLKNAVSKANSEAADYKRQLKAKMSDDEKASTERDEAYRQLQEDYNALTKRVTVSDNKAKLIAMGYAEDLADKAALAMADGDMVKVMEYQASHLKSFEKSVMSRTIQNTPKPTPDGGDDSVMTKEKFRKLTPAERLRFSTEHPDEYKQLYS